MAWKKGQSGNPAGGPKDKAFADALRLVVNRDDGTGVKKLQRLAEKLVAEALNGEGWAMCQIADRLDGKPAQEQTVNLRRLAASEVSDDELADIAIRGGEGTAETPIDPSQLN